MIARFLLIALLVACVALSLSSRNYQLASLCTIALVIPFSPNVFAWRRHKRMVTPSRREGHV